jgi:hypothetical protein
MESFSFLDSPYGRVFLHPPLVGNIASFFPLYALDATCKAVKQAREGFVYYRLSKDVTTRFLKVAEFSSQLMKRVQDMKRVRVIASFKGNRNEDGETFVNPDRLDAIKDADEIVLYLRDTDNFTEFTRDRVWKNVSQLTISRYPYRLSSFTHKIFPNLRRLLIRVAEDFSLTPLIFLSSLEYLEIDCAKTRSSSVSGNLVGTPEYLTKLTHITLDHFPASTADFVGLKSVTTLEMHAQNEFSIESRTINESFPNLQCIIQRPFRNFSAFATCRNLREIHVAPNSIDSFPPEFDKLIRKLTLIEWNNTDGYLCRVTDRIQRLQALEELIFHYSPYAVDLSFIRKLKKLRVLDVRKCFDIEDFSFIKQIRVLEVLKVRSLSEDLMDLIKDLNLKAVVVSTQPSDEIIEMPRNFVLSVETVQKGIITFPKYIIEPKWLW